MLTLCLRYESCYKSLGPIIRDEGEVLNTVLDNIKLMNHAEAWLAWIDHCVWFRSPESRLSPTDIVTRSRDETDTIVTRWNCMCMIHDSTMPLSMFRMKIHNHRHSSFDTNILLWAPKSSCHLKKIHSWMECLHIVVEERSMPFCVVCCLGNLLLNAS